MSIISRLIGAGDLLLYHDYRSGSFRDFSGNNNHGSVTGSPTLQRSGVAFNAASGQYITAGADTLGTGAGSVIVCCNPKNYGQGNYGRLFDNGAFSMYKASNTRLQVGFNPFPATPIGSLKFGVHQIIICSWNTSGTSNTYINNSNVLPSESIGTPSAGTTYTIGNRIAHDRQFGGLITGILVINRELTASEVSEITTELCNKKWNQQTIVRVQNPSLDYLADTLKGYDQITDGTYTATQTIPGTSLYVVSGSFTVGSETVAGVTSKTLTCTSDGIVGIDLTNNNSTSTAYGKWEFYAYRSAGNNTVILPIQSVMNNAGAGNNYNIIFRSTGDVDLRDKTTNIINGPSVSDDTWYKITLTRNIGDDFELFINDVSQGKVNDNSYTSSLYFVIDLDADDKFALKTITNKPLVNFEPLNKNILSCLGNGARETTSNVTSGPLPDTPFEVSSGTFKTTYDTINGKPVKVIECVGSGIIYSPWSRFQNNLSEAAYGTWEFWVNRVGTDNLRILFIANKIGNYTASGQNGYIVSLNPSEALYFGRVLAPSVTQLMWTANNVIAVGSYQKHKVTRASNGSFTYYLDDALVTPIGGTIGTNPFTDNTYTVSPYINIVMIAGDKIAIAGFDGTPLFVKRKGVA